MDGRILLCKTRYFSLKGAWNAAKAKASSAVSAVKRAVTSVVNTVTGNRNTATKAGNTSPATTRNWNSLPSVTKLRNIQKNQAVQSRAAESRAKAEIVEAPLEWINSAGAWLDKGITKVVGDMITARIYAQSIAAQIELKICDAFDYCQNKVQEEILSDSLKILAIDNWGKNNVWGYSAIPTPPIVLAGEYVASMNARYQNTLPEAPDYEYAEDLPDYTDIIQNRMDQTVREYKMNLLKKGPIDTMLDFYNDVKTGGTLDIKNKAVWRNYFAGTEIEEQPSRFIFRGQVMDPGMLGNLTYAYLGRNIGVPGTVLYLGGGWANMENISEKEYENAGATTEEGTNIWSKIDAFSCWFLPYYGDAPEDHETVRQGIEWYIDSLKY